MLLADTPLELFFKEVFLKLKLKSHFDLHLKMEGFSITGSVKAKSALYMIERLEKQGILKEGSEIIESSSGNLGLALAMISAVKGYSFTCISDLNISPLTAQLIKSYGAKLIIVNQKDENGGFLGTRINLIRTMVENNRNLVWVNQYENIDNINAHYHMTGLEILKNFPSPDFLFIGAGTTGTLGGVSKLFREKSPKTKIIAIDSIGSVTFGTSSGKRYIPGLGTSSPPPISKFSSYDSLLMIPEIDTINMCHEMAKKGILLGGSSGTVLCGVNEYAHMIPKNSTVVAISPDLGDRYMDTIYSQDWIYKNYQDTFNEKHEVINNYVNA